MITKHDMALEQCLHHLSFRGVLVLVLVLVLEVPKLVVPVLTTERVSAEVEAECDKEPGPGERRGMDDAE